ncbi:MAG: hypothetical protein AAF740_04425 [Bacteroidota bacterium]
MLTPEWSYMSNPFDNVTRRNHSRMRLLATDHFDKLLKGSGDDPEIDRLYQFGKPAFDAFIKQFKKNTNDAAFYKMQTRRIRDLLDELSGSLAKRWDIRIQVEIEDTTPEYQALLPEGRAVFQNGAYDARINEVEGLAERLTNFPALATLQEEIALFGEKMRKTRTEQQGFEHQGQKNVDLLEARRKELAGVMHAIFGALIHHYYLDLRQAENYYELKYLRASQRSGGTSEEDDVRLSTTLSLEPQTKETLFVGEYRVGDELRVTNTGSVTLLLYPADAPDQVLELGAGLVQVLVVDRTDIDYVIENPSEQQGEAVTELY